MGALAADGAGPLAGVRVVDLSNSYAGPTATMYLAELGADVVKVERPHGGDDARAWGPPFIGAHSAWYSSANRGKRSIVIDLRSDAGNRVLHRLIEQADVLVENLNPAKIARLGLDPDALCGRYSRLIYCAISGFGWTGPDAELPGYDLVAQARSGLMSVTGATGGPPQRVSTALSDVVTGMSAALAISAALVRQRSTGRGDFIDISLLDSDLALMAPRLAAFLAGEPEPTPSGGTDSVLAIYQSFDTADRPIVVAVGNDQIWRRFCRVLDLAELLGDERLTDNAGRSAHRPRIVKAVQQRMLRRPAAQWLSALAVAGVPASKIQSLSEVLADRHVLARGSVLRGGDELTGVIGVHSPFRLASAPEPTRGATVAQLGADSIDVLREAGFDESTIERLLTEGAVQSLAGVATRSGGP